jgi:predicted dehydrogenase
MPIDLDLRVMRQLPSPRDHPIGVIGAGFIVADVQLVAYADAGYRVEAIASRTREHARAVAQRHGIPRVHETWEELLDDERLEVLDIAFPPDQQPAIVEAAAARPHLRGILAQKPLGPDLASATRAVEACEASGTILAVNQNMRFDQSMRALKALLDRGELGEPVLATIDMRAIPHWQPFLEGTDRLTLANMSIHHLDVFRFLFGDPEAIFVSARPDPRTAFAHRDGIVLAVLEWASGLRASTWDDVWAGPVREGMAGDTGIAWRVEGTEGVAQGTIGWPAYPERRPSTLSFASRRHPGLVLEPRWSEVWFPDAFQGTMGDLLGALNGEPLSIPGRDNLQTMALVEAGYRSLEERRLVRIDEVKASQATTTGGR